ncbi:hypothetical protein DFS34DRAFT_598199 [Phlyctochytrium arcticum]|nr:hypothetical protein DFS34DRAFT_598199 [Phlyctochytrium arcticum]
MLLDTTLPTGKKFGLKFFISSCELARYDILQFGRNQDLVPTYIARFNPHDTETKLPFLSKLKVLVQSVRNYLNTPLVEAGPDASVQFFYYGKNSSQRQFAAHAAGTIRILHYIDDLEVPLHNDSNSFVVEDLKPGVIPAAIGGLAAAIATNVGSTKGQCAAIISPFIQTWTLLTLLTLLPTKSQTSPTMPDDEDHQKNPIKARRCSAAVAKGSKLGHRHHKAKLGGKTLLLHNSK